MKRTLWCAALVTALVLGIAGCSGEKAGTAVADAPPAPQMPDEWKVVEDWSVPAAQVTPIGKNLGVELTSLRNTVYDVDGKRVQLNVMVVPDQASVEKLVAALKAMKSEESFFAKELTVYEFVGKDDAWTAIASGRQHLESI